MAKKMYYTEAEATQMLKANKSQLDALVRDGKLRVFMDGDRRMFKTEQVDSMISPSLSGDEEIELTPADLGAADPMAGTTVDSGIRDAIRLDQVKPIKPGKEDTAITSEGISIFDEEDLDVETADPMAKTQIAPSLEDQISIDGVGSGSGLLDLTRESDDTSLGAELLDGINMDGSPASDVGDVSDVGTMSFPSPADEIAPAIVEAIDRNVGLFQGLIVAAGVLTLVVGGIMMAGMVSLIPDYLRWLHTNIGGVAAGLVVLTIAAALIGWYMGKAAAEEKLAMRRAGGRM